MSKDEKPDAALVDAYAKAVEESAKRLERIKVLLRRVDEGEAALDEAFRRLKRAEQAAARFADAMAKAIIVMHWQIEGDFRPGE